MIDTHCHLEMDAFDNDREEVIKRALDAGLEAMITIGSDFQGCKGAVSIAGKYDFIYAAVGIHPHDSKDFTDEIFDQIKTWTSKNSYELRVMSNELRNMKNSENSSRITHHTPLNKVVAIGEIGLDYHYDHSPRDIQQKIFIRQLNYAVEQDIPAIIHSREAKEDTLKILEASGIKRGVMHCFSDDLDMAERAMALGLYISIAGPVTFKKALQLKEIAKRVPDERLLVETDAPFLAPDPHRGKRNEPAFVINTARVLAELRGVTFEDIDRITTINTKKLFGIGEMPAGQIAYQIRDSLYLNITNKCTSKCLFCVRFNTDFVKGHNLRLAAEPSVQELREAIGDPARYREIVFCGFGEPLLRLDVVKAVASWVKEKGGKVRINTNGHGNLIHKRNIVPELEGLVDSMSVSLDAQDEETYQRVCQPAFKNALQEVVDFIKEAKKFVPDVQATIVTAEGVDVDKCQAITDELGVKLRVRRLDIVG